eukprot:TRINITY_DN3390_c0_g1_i3.p1 TRINITY_DN3390_c0_g1~~TRINITY_DN3390_c0_g1_i3.p1  ORF type:complete len:140 (-),score=4.89 TRINITY_DN3390_c0_g1_i3:26-445(-)
MSEMGELYRHMDSFVLPTRGEGWGLPILEAMMAGLPAIATNWSGHLDFLNDRNGYLIEVDHMSLAEGADFPQGSRWAEPSVSHLVKLMRQVSEGVGVQQARSKGKQAQLHVQAHYNKQAVAKQVLDRLRAIHANGVFVH